VLSKHWDAERHEWTDEPPYPFPDIYNPDREEPHITFFGMHLLNKYRHATIKLVESEKTALLMAIAYGNHDQQLWMACGGLEMITRDRLKPLIDQGRHIILYPDRDGIDKWKIKAEQMHYDRLTVDTTPVTEWWREEDGEKADIADVVIRMINNSKPLTSIADVKIVESEKTALLMAIAYGNHSGQVWMACGGEENLNRDKLKPIIEQKRDIILYPDRDGISKWKAKAENLHYDRVTVDCKPVTEWWKPEDGEKADIADVVIRMINNSKTYKTAEEVVADMPKLKALHDKFNLEIAK
jgi:hypothetical protein